MIVKKGLRFYPICKLMLAARVSEMLAEALNFQGQKQRTVYESLHKNNQVSAFALVSQAPISIDQ